MTWSKKSKKKQANTPMASPRPHQPLPKKKPFNDVDKERKIDF